MPLAPSAAQRVGRFNLNQLDEVWFDKLVKRHQVDDLLQRGFDFIKKFNVG